MTLSLDQIAAAAEDAKRQQQREGIRQMNAEMTMEIERIKAEDWQAPPDVPTVYEQAAPLDWALREAFAKDKARQGLAEEQTETLADIVKPWFEIEETD